MTQIIAKKSTLKIEKQIKTRTTVSAGAHYKNFDYPNDNPNNPGMWWCTHCGEWTNKLGDNSVEKMCRKCDGYTFHPA